MNRKWLVVLVALGIVSPVVVLAATLTTNTTVTGAASVIGALSKGSGSFVIDHPLDPKNKLLYHSFVESPDVKNIYSGVVQLDENGEVTVYLPSYFPVLNMEYRYLASPLSSAMPNLHLQRGVRRVWLTSEPSFVLSGGIPHGEVSWQVTGIRKDPFIETYPIEVEVPKGPDQIVDIGECIHEELCK
ncbi:MAG: hypothetical protein AAB421_05780 [Patescibacteria group bacterium]